MNRIFTRRFPLFDRVYEAIMKEHQWYIKAPCIECKVELEIPVKLDRFERWINKEAHIQDAMPDLDAGLREMFLSGICPDCWRRIFKEVGDDDE